MFCLFVLFSDPSAEEAETELKASALLDAIIRPDANDGVAATTTDASDKGGDHDDDKNVKADNTRTKKVLLVDHEDSFVHTLANYLRQTGAEVITCRSGSSLSAFVRREIDTGNYKPDLVVLSPGPGSPSDFFLSDTINIMIERRIPIFGVRKHPLLHSFFIIVIAVVVVVFDATAHYRFKSTLSYTMSLCLCMYIDCFFSCYNTQY